MPVMRPYRRSPGKRGERLCPVCGRSFPNRTRCLQHLNQPRGRCHASLHHAALDASQTLTEQIRAQAESMDDSEEEDCMNYADEDEDMDHADEGYADEPMDYADDNGQPLFDDVPIGPHKEFYEGAARTYGKGETFMDKFHANAYADQRKGNTYYPFSGREEWEAVSFLVTKSGMTQAAIDQFLKLKLVQKMHLSFKTAKDLRNRVEMLPAGPQWHAVEWPISNLHPVKGPVTVYYRNPLECLQALISNPLVQDFIHFTPFRQWKAADKLMRIYNEWLSGDEAWRLQGQYREGATVLGAVLSSDKTTLTSMTGNHCAHPVLLSTTALEMDFRSKASHNAFVMFCLMPIVKFLEKNAELRGVLVSRIFHAILDFVLEPLKNTARVGHMMMDPLGWRRWCYTPLVGYIVDTPESALIAGVAGKRSSVTTATYKEFGDDFRHPARTATYTLAQLKKLRKKVHPWRLHEYVKEAKKIGLNGVHQPFWRDWCLADPALFLTPEILHHWLKFFFDHVVKWCIAALGAEEIDFRFSVLRPHTGMRHFKAGISQAKQMTGREHRDIQRYIVPVIAGAVSEEFLITIAALNDFFYEGQAPEIDEDVLKRMEFLLQRFHDHKDAILQAGVRTGKNGPIDNWYIPKLEFLLSVVASIRANGVPLQWSADVTERAHITLVKEPAEHTNNHNYEPQICRYLDRKDKCRQFDLATAIVTAGIEFGDCDLDEAQDDDDEEGSDEPPLLLNTTSALLNRIDSATRLSGTNRASPNYFRRSSLLAEGLIPNAPTPHRTFTSLDNRTAFHLGRDYVGPRLTLAEAVDLFQLPDLGPALAAYYLRSQGKRIEIGGKRPRHEANPFLLFDKIEFWKSVRIQSRSYHHGKILAPETVNATPPNRKGPWKYGRADAVIVNQDSDFQWPSSGLQGHAVCQLRMVLRIASAHPLAANEFLAYVQRFDVVPQKGEDGKRGAFPEPASGMYQLKRSYRSDNTPMGDIVPLDRLRVPVELTPRFGKVANTRLTKETSLDVWEDFWLSKWFNKEFFHAIS